MAQRPNNEILYPTIQDFLNLCLIQNRSLLWPDKEFWILENLRALKKNMIEATIFGHNLSFEEKLEKQMDGLAMYLVYIPEQAI